MVVIKAYNTKQYYLSKYGEKNFISGDGKGIDVAAALLTGKGLQSEEVFLYEAVGSTLDEAQRALDNWLTHYDLVASRTEIHDDEITNLEYTLTEEDIDQYWGMMSKNPMGDYSTCTSCPFRSIINDRDPHDWFCDDDVALVCTKTKNDKQDKHSKYNSDQQGFKPVTTSCRPYNIEKETRTPEWCPLKVMTADVK